MNQQKSIRMTPEEAHAFVESHNKCALVSLGADGYPHIVAMNYVTDNGDILMTSYGRAQKVLNFKRNPRAAIMIDTGRKYKDIKGVMLRGQVEVVEGPDAVAQVISMVTGGQQAAGNAGVPTEQVKRRAAKRAVIRFHPERVSSWDHSKIIGDY